MPTGTRGKKRAAAGKPDGEEPTTQKQRTGDASNADSAIEQRLAALEKMLLQRDEEMKQKDEELQRLKAENKQKEEELEESQAVNLRDATPALVAEWMRDAEAKAPKALADRIKALKKAYKTAAAAVAPEDGVELGEVMASDCRLPMRASDMAEEIAGKLRAMTGDEYFAFCQGEELGGKTLLTEVFGDKLADMTAEDVKSAINPAVTLLEKRAATVKQYVKTWMKVHTAKWSLVNVLAKKKVGVVKMDALLDDKGVVVQGFEQYMNPKASYSADETAAAGALAAAAQADHDVDGEVASC